MAESAPSPLVDLIEAFNTLISEYPALISHFQDAFEFRRKDLSLTESQAEGLTLTLAELLVRPVSDRCFVAKRYSSLPCPQVDTVFAERFRKTLMDIQGQYPLALEWMEKNRRRKHFTTVEFLRSLLELYVDNKATYPY